MANDKNIYSSLQIISDSDELQLKPQSQENDFGVAGQVFSNSVGVAGAYSQEKIKVLFDANDKLDKQVGSQLIKVNFGIFNVLYKKLEQKSNEKIVKELAIEGATGYVVTKSIETGFVIKQAAKQTGKKVGIRAGISIAARIFTGIGTGAIIGSKAPIVGTIIGAVAGGIIASKIEDKVFEDEKKEQEKIKQLNEEITKIYSKINQMSDYLIRNNYIELRELNEIEVEKLFKSASSLDITYLETIQLMLSFPHYLKKESKQEVYSPLSPQGISFPYSSIIYLTTIKALKDTLKEYLPKAKKIVLYTPNPFVSLYTSSPSYIFNSNLSFFNPHLQYLLTSKDTQQWLYDILFSLARDNREIIVYEWGGSVEELDSKESQANKKDLDSKDTNQSTNIQKQTKTYYLSPQGQKLKEKQPYCIKVIAKESKVFTILRDFITSFNTTKEQEVFRALEILLKDKESLEHLRQCIIKSLKEPIIESIYSLKETKDLNKEELKENVEEVFNNLLGVIEKIYKEGSAYLYKQVLLFFLEIFNLFNIQSVFKKSNALNFGESLALSSNQTLLNVLKWANSKYNYALIHPILKIFTQDLVPLFALIENTMCHNTLILDDKMLIELSSFNLNSYPKIKANLEQNLAICIKSKEAVFGHLEDSHQENQKTANLENTESKEDKQSTNFQKQTSLKELESNLENTLKVA